MQLENNSKNVYVLNSVSSILIFFIAELEHFWQRLYIRNNMNHLVVVDSSTGFQNIYTTPAMVIDWYYAEG